MLRPIDQQLIAGVHIILRVCVGDVISVSALSVFFRTTPLLCFYVEITELLALTLKIVQLFQ